MQYNDGGTDAKGNPPRYPSEVRTLYKRLQTYDARTRGMDKDIIDPRRESVVQDYPGKVKMIGFVPSERIWKACSYLGDFGEQGNNVCRAMDVPIYECLHVPG